MEKIAYGGWPNCIKLTNGRMELVITTDVGPRIIRLGFIGGQNMFKEYAAQMGTTGADKWNIYGGHRLWHAPEVNPRTYVPDNVPVKYAWDGKTLKLGPQVEKETGIEKAIEITLDGQKDVARIVHRLTNRNVWDVELAPWCLSVMNANGRAIFPQEEYRPHPDCLLPARPLVLWHFTDMSDPRWIWGKKYVQLRQNPSATTKQKIGLGNTKGWAAYALNGELFIKRYGFDRNATYADFGCNTETYTDSDMLEVESLGPLTKLAPGQSVEHVETWSLHKLDVSADENDIDAKVLPLI